MTDQEFAAGIDAIILSGIRGHAAHRALDLWWTRFAIEYGGDVKEATERWMKAIEGDHRPGARYPLGRPQWWQFWRWENIGSGGGNPCP